MRTRKILRPIVYNLSLPYIYLLDLLGLTDKDKIFIIGHMRAGTSLLTHILQSNKEIEGVGETHMKYTGKNDHLKLYQQLLIKQRKLLIRKRFILDKILHRNYIIDNKIFNSDRTKIIVIVRDSEASLKSLISMKLMKERGWNVEQVNTYYVRQLQYIKEYVKNFPKKEQVFFLTYSELVNDSAAVLGAMSKFLDLKEPLTTEYQTNRNTGKRSYGDLSSNIKSGKILKKRASEYEGPEISEGLLEKSDLVYNDVVQEIRSLLQV